MVIKKKPIKQQKNNEIVESFRKLYFHLYGNSNASRAERIFEDLGKLLLIKILSEDSKYENVLQDFVKNNKKANEVFFPILTSEFPELISQNDKFTLDDESIKLALSDLSKIRFSESPATVLGDAFQTLIGPGLRGDKGQFFTPKELVKAMVQIVNPKSNQKFIDPACGTGGFLVEAYSQMQKNNESDNKVMNLIGIDKDKDMHRLGGSLVQIATNRKGKVFQYNSLDLKELAKIEPNPFNADVILTNPPFGAKIGITDKKILQQFELGHEWTFSESSQRWRKENKIRTSQDPQILFIEVCLRLLKPGGIMGIVLPEGVFGNKKSGYVWDFIRKYALIEKMIDCPRTTFQPSTDTKTNVLFLKKKSNRENNSKIILISTARFVGHDRRGKTKIENGDSVQNDFKKIAESYSGKANKWWKRCKISEPYYLVPRYYFGKDLDEIKSLGKKLDAEFISLGKLIENKSIEIRKGDEVGADAYGTGNIPFVRTSDITNWELSNDPTNGISEEIYEQYQLEQNLKPGDILFVVDGRYKIGKTAILTKHNCKCIVQSHFLIISTKNSSPISNYELLYILNLPEIKNQIQNLIFIQSTLGSIGKRINELMIPIPEKNDSWKRKINKFKKTIEERAKLLEKLSKLNDDF